MTSPEFERQANQPDMPPDPFSPKKVYFETPGGIALNAVATAESYSNPSVPYIDAGSFKKGDVVQIELAAQEPQAYVIEDMVIPSMSFGSDDIRSPEIHMMLTNGEQAGDRVRLVGSSISPAGTLMTPGSVKVGMHLNTFSDRDGDTVVSPGVITGFSIKRRAEDSRYVEVPLNHQDAAPQESQSFVALKDDYTELIGILSEKGFDFEDVDANGLPARYRKLYGRTLVYACNQGFGHNVLRQHEAYAYNADKQQLLGMRYLPAKQIAQMTIMQGVSPELYAEETMVAYDADWRQSRGVEPSALHRMSHEVPFVTYTWLSGSVKRPTITVKANAGVRGMDRLQGRAYYEMNITQTAEGPLLSAARPGWWVDDPERYKALEVTNTVLSDSDDHSYKLSFADLSVELAKDPSALRSELIKAFRQDQPPRENRIVAAIRQRWSLHKKRIATKDSTILE